MSCPYTPQQNGCVGRKNRHIVEVGLSLLAHSFAPKKFWSYAFQAAVFLINRLPTPILNFQSPYAALYHNPLIINCCDASVVPVFPFSAHIMVISCNLDLESVFFWVIVLLIRDIYVSIYLQGDYMSLVMLFSTRTLFLFNILYLVLCLQSNKPSLTISTP